jgi:hypothetical protein
MCKPVLPFLQDEIAHILWKAHHLATVHHHHGDRHTEQEIAEAKYPENPNTQAATAKISEPVSVHLVVEFLYGMLQLRNEKQLFAVKVFNVAGISVDKYYPPPKCC